MKAISDCTILRMRAYMYTMDCNGNIFIMKKKKKKEEVLVSGQDAVNGDYRI